MESLQFDLVVVGGGLSGLCCAIAAARNGVKTALIQNRPMLGGNASSEICMHVCGAAGLYCRRQNARETGIVEELLLENKRRNPHHSFSLWDGVLWEKAKAEENLSLFLNCHIFDVRANDGRVEAVEGVQMTTERRLAFSAPLFVDATGDAFIAAKAGATILRGTEGANDYGEACAPKQATRHTMGNSLLFRAVDRGYRVPYAPPTWAKRFTEADLKDRDHGEIESGYWWIELGGERDVISDFEEIRDELYGMVYGVWDHIKNGGDHGADNYELVWVQALPGKRESRRVLGDYLLTANDLLSSRRFPDAVAYGGWPIDVHPPRGLAGTDVGANRFYELQDVYQIPYRCLYAKDVDNLFVGGRAFSLTHAAFASARVMGTTAVVGQAIGAAAALCIQYGLSARELYTSDRIHELQQLLLRDDCYIPHHTNEDPLDLARSAQIESSSGDPSPLQNGGSRPVGATDNAWQAALDDPAPTLVYRLAKEAEVARVLLKFDSDLNTDLMITLDPFCARTYRKTPPPSLVSDFSVELLCGGEVVRKRDVENSCIRNAVVSFDAAICDAVRVTLKKTWGESAFRLFEVRIYR